MQPDSPRPGQCRQEQPFTAEKRVLEAADKLNVVIDARLEGDEAAGVELEGFAGSQGLFAESAAGVDQNDSVSDEFLHDEAFAAEQGDADFLLKRNADLHAASSAQE